MADIKDRINSIKEYFIEMQVVNVSGENIIYVVVKFPRRWIIADDIQEKFNVDVTPGNNQSEYYFCAKIDVGFEPVFDAIEYNIDKMISAEERAALLEEKCIELKKLFADENITLEALRTLEFVYGKLKLKPGRKKEETVEEQTDKDNEGGSDNTEVDDSGKFSVFGNKKSKKQ